MFSDPEGPIEGFEWGQFQINGGIHAEGGEGVGKDICIVGGDVKAWKARKGHRLKPNMLDCLEGQVVLILVIGNGVRGRIRVPKKTRKAIVELGIETLIVEKTPKACETFNNFYRAGKRVALLAHGTC